MTRARVGVIVQRGGVKLMGETAESSGFGDGGPGFESNLSFYWLCTLSASVTSFVK